MQEAISSLKIFRTRGAFHPLQ